MITGHLIWFIKHKHVYLVSVDYRALCSIKVSWCGAKSVQFCKGGYDEKKCIVSQQLYYIIHTYQ